MKKKTAIVIQARMGSSRFPGKVLKNILNRPVLEWVVSTSKSISDADDVIVATTANDDDKLIVDWCLNNDVSFSQGDENNVLKRYFDTAVEYSLDNIIRITADCPFIDPEIIRTLIKIFEMNDLDYVSNIDPPTWPDGLDCEIFNFKSLKEAYERSKSEYDKEHVTTYIRNNKYTFKSKNLVCPIEMIQSYRWTLDTEDDYVYLDEIAKTLPDKYKHNPSERSYLDLLSVSNSESIIKIDKERDAIRNSFAKAIISKLYTTGNSEIKFTNSNEEFTKVSKYIPLATQTFSKSSMQMPGKKSPLFISHGRDGHVWDIDGNRYVDLIGGLLPVVLGYCDVDVDYAIRNQLDRGISFSLASLLESKLAEKLIDIIPSAEAVRFGKNGSDVTSAAIRLARAYTGKERIAASGYHGWHDWYIGSTTRNLGVPESVQKLTHKFPFNNIHEFESLINQYPDEFAAVIVEPVGLDEPDEGYLNELVEVAHKNKMVVIFDEIITGFRIALGGAQSLYGVTPDLSCFGKSMGNGMPISAIVGRKDIMKEMESIFYSSTFAGEALSLAAAIAVIDKIKSNNVIEKLWSYGNNLNLEINAIITQYDLNDVVQLRGIAPWTIIDMKDHGNISELQIKTFFKKEMYKHGVLIGGSHNICFAHDENDKYQVINAYKNILGQLKEHINNNSLISSLDCEVIKPIFEVRTTK